MVTLKLLLKGRPDTNAENSKYVAEMVECLAYLTEDEMRAITSPRDGLHTVCRYLPTPADVHGFLRDRKARQEAILPAPTTYRKLNADDPAAPWNKETDVDRKKRAVRELLGYDPDDRTPKHRVFTPPTPEDLSKLELKTPAAPPSEYLLKALRAQGYRFPQEDK
jgi:hypothetical protein